MVLKVQPRDSAVTLKTLTKVYELMYYTKYKLTKILFGRKTCFIIL